MRKIEREMVAAVESLTDWSKDNTAVRTYTHDGERFWSEVYLHGNRIATVDTLKCGANVYRPHITNLLKWPTRTTMSRLRALGFDVCTRKGVVHLNGNPL